VRPGLAEVVSDVHPASTTWTLSDGSTSLRLDALAVRIAAVPGRLVVDAVPRGP
jgi:hypothetical protein